MLIASCNYVNLLFYVTPEKNVALKSAEKWIIVKREL